MIAIDKVKQHINAIDLELISEHVTKNTGSKLATVRSTLVSIIAILDTNISEFLVDKQHELIKDKLNRYEEAKRNVPHDYYRKKTLADLEAQYNPKSLRGQLMVTNYILQKNNDLLCGFLSPPSL